MHPLRGLLGLRSALPAWAEQAGGRAKGASGRYGYLVLVAAAGLVLTQTVRFEAPERVRDDPKAAVGAVGEVLEQEFSRTLAHPQAVQVRATLRHFADEEAPVGDPDPDVDAEGKVLSQPVVTTLFGLAAAMEQSVRLEGGELEIDLKLEATPRLESSKSRSADPRGEITLEHLVEVKSRRERWFDAAPQVRTHLHTRGTLAGVEARGHRVVFQVDEHLFSLDVEVHR